MPIVVAFISQKGGVGKSTLARALAAVAAHAGLTVTLADLDPQQNSALRWEKTRSENKISPTVTVESFETIGDALTSTEDADLLVVDAPGRTSRATLDIARASHLIVQPSGPSVDDLHPAVLLFHELIQAGIARNRLVAAICRTLTKAEEDAARGYLKAAGYAVLSGSIPERSAYREAQNRGQALTETKQDELSQRADTLMDALLQAVGEQVKAAGQDAKKKGKGTESAA
jgi:chromosome partitioning protein